MNERHVKILSANPKAVFPAQKCCLSNLQGFENHVKNEHNQWAYIFFMIHLMDTHKSELSALEGYIHRRVNIIVFYNGHDGNNQCYAEVTLHNIAP